MVNFLRIFPEMQSGPAPAPGLCFKSLIFNLKLSAMKKHIVLLALMFVAIGALSKQET
ncbi:MAG: hypothetical protein KDD10_29575 [Phaeodactylibacter sp.]|nr:hypothetical protein [Phaeodactylibacter sp.]MCB9296095.1 hypothetical protein [Lewinellaceae bacterium]